MSHHTPVLYNEVISGLVIAPDDIIVDGTVNGGGHAALIAEHLSEKGHFIGIDQDSSGLEITRQRLSQCKATIDLVHDNTRNLDHILDTLSVTSIQKILLDLGWSSNQFENPQRGFSIQHEGPLLMTLSNIPGATDFTAYDIINEWEKSSLIDIFVGYGEERYAGRIAEAIIQKRKESPIKTTKELADIIYQRVPASYRHGRIHPATKVFQALRITVNDEMGALKEILVKSFKRLAPGGRILVISFHSIEDRIVKNFFKQKKEQNEALILTKRPITASEQELLENNKARSAKLRILQKL